MSDLQTLAGETTTKLSTLADATETTQAKLTDVKSELTRIRQAVEAAWATLGERAQGLVEQVNTGKTALASEVDGVTQAIAQLKETIDNTQTELTGELEATKSAIAAIDDRLAELDLEGDITEAEAALNDLADKDIGTEVGESTTAAIEELNGFSGELSAFESGLEGQVDGLESTLNDEVVPGIEGGAQQIGEHFDGLVEHFNTAIAETSSNLEEAIRGLMEQVGTAQGDLFTQLEGTAGKLDEQMGQLESAVETAKTSVVDATAALVEGIELSNESLEKAIELLTESKDALEAV